MIRQGESELNDMNFYHHVRSLKDAHAYQVSHAPIDAQTPLPHLSFDAPVSLSTHSLSDRDSLPAVKTTIPTPSPSASNGNESDWTLVENHLYKLSDPELKTLGLSRRQVNRTSLTRLLRAAKIPVSGKSAKAEETLLQTLITKYATYLRARATTREP